MDSNDTSTPRPSLWRIFVGLPVDDAARATLARASARLQREVRSGVQWVAPEKLHVTLAFLGDVTPEQVASFSAALRPRLAGVGPFAGTVAGLGTYGRPTAPSVIWAGIAAGTETLAALAARTAETCAALGLRTDERLFHAHVTLGRVKRARARRDVLQAIAQMPPGAVYGGLPGDCAIIYRCELTSTGVVYTVLDRLPL